MNGDYLDSRRHFLKTTLGSAAALGLASRFAMGSALAAPAGMGSRPLGRTGGAGCGDSVMADTTYLEWPFFSDAHRALARDLAAWTKAEIAPHEHDEDDVDALSARFVALGVPREERVAAFRGFNGWAEPFRRESTRQEGRAEPS